MLLQKLIWLAALFGLVWLVRRLFSGQKQPRGTGARSSRVPSRGEDEMVRDRVCNTFLPRSRALVLHAEDGERYFCSERCRRTYQERLPGDQAAG